MTFQPKQIRSRPTVTTGSRLMKRYDVTNTTDPISSEVEQAALAILPQLVAPPDNPGDRTAGWVILHEGGDGVAMFLTSYSWVWDNVVEVHAAVAAEPHVGCPDRDSTNFVLLERPWMGCTWELAPFGHERSAWVRHMFGAEKPDLDAYLADVVPDGPAGQPN